MIVVYYIDLMMRIGLRLQDPHPAREAAVVWIYYTQSKLQKRGLMVTDGDDGINVHVAEEEHRMHDGDD